MKVSFDEYLEDSQLGGFSLPDLSTYTYQLTAYRAFDAMPPRDGDLERFNELTGRTEWPVEPLTEIHNNYCRRGWKSGGNMHRAAWHGIDDSHLADIARGERCKIRITCPSKQQAQDCFQFLLGIFEAPMLELMIDKITADCISLTNRIDIVVQPASYRTMRGGSTKAWFFDEANFLYIDGVNALPELLAAADPSLATIRGSRKYLTSSVYKQVGEMPEAKRRYWGVNDAPVLVTQADWTKLRPDIDPKVIDAAMARDPERARAEWFSEERTDLADAFSEVWIDDAMSLRDCPIPRSVHEGWRYFGFVDVSGGAKDAAALSIALVEPGKDLATVVFQHRWPAPHSPASVIREASAFLEQYGCHSVAGDRYAAGFVIDAFGEAGIQYRHSELTRSEIYLEAVPLMATGKIELPKNERLRRELISLQRRTRSGGRDSIDHPPGGSDDLCNAVLGAAVMAWKSRAMHTDWDLINSVNESILAAGPDMASGSLTDNGYYDASLTEDW